MKLSILSLFTVLFLSFNVQTIAQGGAADADMVVAADGSGDFTSLQEAINSVPSNSELRTVIYIKRGTYNEEKVIVPADKINVSLIGESREETVISYHIYDCAQGKCPVDDAALWSGDNIRTSATLTILGEGFRAENLTIENTAGPVGQAQAITVRADRVVFVNCDLTGYQDTIYLWSNGNRTYFENCLVVGRTDYIYGGGIAVFNMCEIRSWGGGWITAPSTSADQDYGFVFYECEITYADNSPRAGDDGQLFGLGRPWHNCPKVAWLYCDMTGMVNPLGWPTTWNMDYAPDSSGLHLYEYGNTGDGADMSGRANWVGIRELSEAEAALYTPQVVLAGEDNWDPTATPPLVTTYNWTGAGASDGWLLADNWDPAGVPAKGEAAIIGEGNLVLADGGDFEADLSLNSGATLEISDSSTVTLLSISKGMLSAAGTQALEGRVRTRDTATISTEGELKLYTQLSGVHEIIKTGTGNLELLEDNSGFTGSWIISEGSLSAKQDKALGKAAVYVSSGASLILGHEAALQPTSPLYVETGATLDLDVTVTLSQFYIDGTMMEPGEYDAGSNPGLISGQGRIVVGRPTQFVFVGGANGNWDEAVNYIPALLPGSGDTVLCEREIETTATVYAPTLFISNGGRLRLRGDPSRNHRATGNIHFGDGTSVAYNTGGTGMAITAPMVVEGDVILNMESGDETGSTMTLNGPISGVDTIYPRNNGKGTENWGKVLLRGNNSGFSGVWDLTLGSEKYPDLIFETYIEGAAADAFGSSRIVAGDFNKVILNHKFCAGDTLDMVLTGNAKADLKTLVFVKGFYFNGEKQENGSYDASTHPSVFEGAGSLVVNSELDIPSGPTNLTATDIRHDQVGLSWTINSDNADGHVIRMNSRNVDTVQVDTFTLDGLFHETTYTIGVYAYNLLGNSDTVFIEVTTAAKPVGIGSEQSADILLFPNPVKDILYLQGMMEAEWEIYGMKGRLLQTGSSSSIDVSELGRGSYILKVRDDRGAWKHLKFLKE